MMFPIKEQESLPFAKRSHFHLLFINSKPFYRPDRVIDARGKIKKAVPIIMGELSSEPNTTTDNNNYSKVTIPSVISQHVHTYRYERR